MTESSFLKETSSKTITFTSLGFNNTIILFGKFKPHFWNYMHFGVLICERQNPDSDLIHADD